MPPFISLSDRERWDVVAYALSLSVSPESIVKGEKQYKDLCARCHGEQGTGAGPEAASLSTRPTNLTDLAYMSDRSALDLLRAIAIGSPPDMPSFGDKLSQDELWAITDYLRSFTFTKPQEISATTVTTTPLTTAEPELAATAVTTSTQGIGSITGIVTNGSGGDLPLGLTVMLHGFDNMQAVITQTTTVQSNSSYEFRGVEMVEGRAYVATVDYDQLTYGSDISVVPPKVNTLDLPVTVYETTTDSSIITVDRLHFFFELIDEDTARVVELYIMSNPTDKTLVSADPDQPIVRFRLPVGSSNLAFEDGVLGERYLETPDGFGDTAIVRPGSGNYQVLFTFEMPYNRKLELAQPVLQKVEAVVILVPEGSVRIRSEMLQDDGIRDVQGARYHLYSGGSLEPGQELRLTITGQPGGAPSLDLGSQTSLLVGVGFFSLALVLAGGWVYRRFRLRKAEEEGESLETISAPTQENIETVMDAIIALDDLFQAGQLPEKAYRQKRAELKARLKDLKEAAQ